MNKKSIFYYILPKFWEKHHRMHFYLNVLFGVVIAMILHFFELTKIGNNILASEMDQIIKKEASNVHKIPENLAFIDIDSETENFWNLDMENTNNTPDYSLSTLITRRDSLSSLLRKTLSFSPKIIIFDMMFEFYSPNESHDSSFIAEIEKFKISNSSSKLLLPFPERIENLREHKIYKHLINSDKIIFSSVNVASDFQERTIRYIYTYRNYPGIGKVWSLPILTYCIMHNLDYKQLSLEKLEEAGIKLEDENPFHQEGINFLSSRIRYLLSPSIINPKTGTVEFFGNIDNKKDIHFSALELTTNLEGNSESYFPDSVLQKSFSNKIVIIGNSTIQKGDIHLTPIGEIPGMYIIGNAINTILNVGLVKSPPFFFFLFIELLTILICAYLFLHLQDIVASIIGFIIIGVPLSYVTYFIFIYTGFFLTSTFALIGIALHKIIIDIEKFIDASQHKVLDKNKEFRKKKSEIIHFNK